MTGSTAPAPDEEPAGGDEVCWLHRLCPECGAMPSADARVCWRCGIELPDEPPD